MMSIHSKMKRSIDKINLADVELDASVTEYFNALQKVEDAKKNLNTVLAASFLKHGKAEFDNAISNEIVIKQLHKVMKWT